MRVWHVNFQEKMHKSVMIGIKNKYTLL